MKSSYLLFGIFFLFVYQGCLAAEKSNDAIQKVANKSSASEASILHTPKPRDAAYRSSPYKPENLLLSLDFEDESIEPIKGQESTYEKLVLQTPGGRTTAVGIMYEGGSKNDRRALIVPDPENDQNKTLYFGIKNARIPGAKKGKFKGRIQINLDKLQQYSLFQRYRLYLHPDIALYRQFPESNGWFGLSTMWMGAVWQGHKYPFKISVNIVKQAGAGMPLYFDVSGGIFEGGDPKRGRWKNIWGRTGTDFQVPVGEWIDMEIGYRAGDKKTGRIYMAVKREKDEAFTTIVDMAEWTYHPLSPDPVPITDLQPLKLYSSDRIIKFLRSRGGMARLFWDDYEAYQKW